MIEDAGSQKNETQPNSQHNPTKCIKSIPFNRIRNIFLPHNTTNLCFFSDELLWCFPLEIKKIWGLKVGNHWIRPYEAKTKQSHCWIVHSFSKDVLKPLSWLVSRKDCSTFLFIIFSGVNSAACELEHLLLLITPELIFLPSPLSSSRLPSIQTYLTLLLLLASSLWQLSRRYAQRLRPTPPLQPSVAASLSQRIKPRQRDPFCVFQPLMWLESFYFVFVTDRSRRQHPQKGKRDRDLFLVFKWC